MREMQPTVTAETGPTKVSGGRPVRDRAGHVHDTLACKRGRTRGGLFAMSRNHAPHIQGRRVGTLNRGMKAAQARTFRALLSVALSPPRTGGVLR